MVRVASYNIHKGIGLDRRRSPERTLHVLREIDADVIALQEADRRFGSREAVIPPRLLLEHSPWRFVPLGRRAQSSGWHGNSLLVRRDATIDMSDAIHLPALEPRGAVVADIVVAGKPLRVIGLHLDISGLWRRRQARAILRRLEEMGTRPTMIMGDTNAWGSGGCLHDFGKHFSFAETGPSFHARAPIARLDRIMVSGLRVLDAGVHASATARVASDHLPVWAELELA